MFDVNLFTQQTVTEANSTESLPCPAGDWPAQVKEYKIRQWTSKEDSNVGGLALDVQWSIEDEGVKAALERKEVVVQQSIMLDITDAGQLDMGKGKNVGLGRLRDSLGLNQPGQAFSFTMLTGGYAKVTVIHEPYKETIFAKVKGVVKAH